MDQPKRTRVSPAISEAERLDRRSRILEAAEKLLRERGIDEFSMSSLAKAAGLAKGTTYRYFATKGDLFLELHHAQFAAWRDALIAATPGPMPDDTFCKIYLETTKRFPIFLEVTAQFITEFEGDLPTDRLTTVLRKTSNELAPLARHLSKQMGFDPSKSAELLTGLFALLLGAKKLDFGKPIEQMELPSDAAVILESTTFDRIFLLNATHIVAGARFQANTKKVAS